MLPSIPFRLRNYVVEKEINRGGYGVVYLAHSLAYDTKFAIKMCPTQLNPPKIQTETQPSSNSMQKEYPIPFKSSPIGSLNARHMPKFTNIPISGSQPFSNLSASSENSIPNPTLTARSRVTANMTWSTRAARHRASFSNPIDSPIPSFQEALEMNANSKIPTDRLESKLSNSEACEKIYKSFLKEVQILQLLSNQNIIKIYDYFHDSGYFFMVLEYCSGKSLEDLLISHPDMPFNVKLDIIFDIANAIRYCHLMKVAHRDIKLSNILFDRDGRVKLADFGISKVLDEPSMPARPVHLSSADSLPSISAQKTMKIPSQDFGDLSHPAIQAAYTTENLLQFSHHELHAEYKKFEDIILKFEKIEGSVFYLPPELCLKQDYSPYKADSWAFGILIARFLTNVFPFNGQSNTEIINKIKGGIGDFNYRCPLTAVVNGLLQSDPNQRLTIFEACQGIYKVMKQVNHIQNNIPCIDLESRLTYLPPNIKELGSYSTGDDDLFGTLPPSGKLAANAYANAYLKMKKVYAKKKAADITFA